MKLSKLTKKEEQMLADIEAGKFVRVDNFEKAKKDAMLAAKNTLNKTKNINIRISERVLSKLKIKAAEEGMPYQTLAASVLHKFATK